MSCSSLLVIQVQLPPRSLTGQSWSHTHFFFNRDDPIPVNSHLKTLTVHYAARGLPSASARIHIYALLPSGDGFVISQAVEIPSSQISTESIVQSYSVDEKAVKLAKGSFVGLRIDDTRAAVAMANGGHLMIADAGKDSDESLIGRSLKFKSADPTIGASLAYTVIA